jgi:monothiol glutaredoxin
MSLDESVRQEIAELIGSSDVVLFMKGNRRQPQCGFSATVVGILDAMLPEYKTVDVLSAPHIREGIKTYSSWPTIPQLYVKGEFVGGCDIVQEMYGSGELFEALGLEPVESVRPRITITPPAPARARRRGGRARRRRVASCISRSTATINPICRSRRAVASTSRRSATASSCCSIRSPPRGPTASRSTSRTRRAARPSGSTTRMRRASGRCRWASSRRCWTPGSASSCSTCARPRSARSRRFPARCCSHESEAARIESLPRDTPLVLHCHHGGRSQQAAEQFVSLGFSQVWNVVGGIDAWSQEIDSDVPRY